MGRCGIPRGGDPTDGRRQGRKERRKTGAAPWPPGDLATLCTAARRRRGGKEARKTVVRPLPPCHLATVCTPARPRRHPPWRDHSRKEGRMSKLLRGIAAGWGAKKLGGGCFTTILIFLLLWWLLGNFDIFK